jgi:hypothetical protein
VIKSYSLKHELGDELFPLLKAYRDAVNSVLEELWNSIEWKKAKLMERNSGGSCQITRLTSTAESTRRSSGTIFLRIGLTQPTGLTQQ